MKTVLFSIFAASIGLASCSDGASSSQISGRADLQTYTNPVLWEDLADIDIFRVNDTYYYSASNMAFSPGAPILSSKDLVNWEYIGHSVPRLDFGMPDAYSLEDGKQAYVQGIYASSMRYRASTDTWYWIGCVDSDNTYIYTAAHPEDTWELVSTIDTCYYDCGLLFDDNDDIYVAYGNTKISVAQLNDDLTEKSVDSVFNGTFYIEGSRMYQVNGTYYILTTEPASAEWTLKSSGGPLGPYEIKNFADAVEPPTPGAGNPHQGGIVDTPEGDWYYLAFIDDYPGGRMPVLSPMSFDSEGWPQLPSNSSFNEPHPYPATPAPVAPKTGSYNFSGPELEPEWEWNHNPDTDYISFNEGLVMKTASVTPDLFHAKNTLTHRILGPSSSATIHLDISQMHSGDRAGLALFRDNMAAIGVQDGTVNLYRDLALGAGWETISTGQVSTSAELPEGADDVYFRLAANIAPESDKQGTFSWSADGESFEQLGEPYTMNTTYFFFVGYRYGVFNFATEELGGGVTLKNFTITAL